MPNIASNWNTTSTATYDLVWSNWVASATSNITATNTVQDHVWSLWNSDAAFGGTTQLTYYPAFQVVEESKPLTAAEIRKQQALERQTRKLLEKQRRRQEREQRHQARLQRLANKRARWLLLCNLNKVQRSEYRKENHFHVITPGGHTYRVDYGKTGNVKLIEEGHIRESLCIHPVEYVPYEDVMLGQKLLLDNNEEQFRRIANITRIA